MKTYKRLFDQIATFPNLWAAFHQARTGKRAKREVAAFEHLLERNLFPSIDHQVLRSLLARRIADPRTMALIDLILASGAGVLESEYTIQHFPGDTLWTPLERARGLPIGNLTSQFWANVYLHELDTFVTQVLRTGAYVRYADDWLLFADDKATLHAWRARVAAKLAELRLVLHDRKTQVYPAAAGVPFLGFRLFANHRRLKRPNVVRFRRRMRVLLRQFAAGSIPMDRMHASVNGWVAHARHGSTYRLRRQLLGGIIVPRAGP